MSHIELPSSLGAQYPLRTLPGTVDDLVGRTGEQVLSALGTPDQTSGGMCWHPQDSAREGHLPYVLVPGGGILRAGVFGPIPKSIHFPTPYETWTYHNVQGASWLLYLVEAGTASVGWRGRFSWLFGTRTNAPSSGSVPQKLRPSPPLVVAEVGSYPEGAVF